MEKIILEQVKKLLGKEIFVENAVDDLQFVKQSKENAARYEWLYHCTNADAFLCILKDREFYLTNLQCVNDQDEARRIDVDAYKHTYYVGCFTRENNISLDHWKEYSQTGNGVLFGVKQNWFSRSARFVVEPKNKENCCGRATANEKIYCDRATAEGVRTKFIHERKIINPFYINSFDFYEMKYDDELKKDIAGLGAMELSGKMTQGRTFVPEVAGIIKKTRGSCEREGKKPYEKNWTSEKEVRLKVGVQQCDISCYGNAIIDSTIWKNLYFPKIAVPFTDDAFDIIKIRFSDGFQDKDAYIGEIKKYRPESKIEILG